MRMEDENHNYHNFLDMQDLEHFSSSSTSSSACNNNVAQTPSPPPQSLQQQPPPNIDFDHSYETHCKNLNMGRAHLNFVDDLIDLHASAAPVQLQLDRLHNESRDKDRDLAEAHAEIKALKLTERSREKALQELSDELDRVDEKLQGTELLLENKNLEVKRINDEKKAAQAGQYAAEATLRRVQSAQKGEDMPPLEAILAPLEAELKLARQEVAKLQEDNRALDRLTKSKEAALLEAERAIQVAEAKASMVDDLQNRNQELTKQIEIFQEENKTLDKMHRQKITEVEKLSTTVAELEEEVLAAGAAANAVRDYQRQIQKLEEEKKTLDRELARAKITANRVAVVVANEWKDESNKVMPVRQWLEERRFLQGEMQQLRDKVALMERTAKSEAQLKEKVQLRLKVLEDVLKNGSAYRSANENVHRRMNGPSNGISNGEVEYAATPKCSMNGYTNNRPPPFSPSRASLTSTMLQKKVKVVSKSLSCNFPSENLSSRSTKASPGSFGEHHKRSSVHAIPEGVGEVCVNDIQRISVQSSEMVNDTVSGQLYDILQKEVLTLRKACHEKDQSLHDKDNAIEMLETKVNKLNRAMELEAKKMRREVAAMEKEVAAMRVDKDKDNESRGNNKRVANTRRPTEYF